jgi:hypothetical protein
VIPLTLGWWYGCGSSHCASHHEQRYLERAAEIWRYWFINPATAMNPNLAYSDIYPGQPSGGIGAVVHVARFSIGLEAIRVIEAGDTEMLVWTAADRKAMRAWIAEFIQWWLYSPLGSNARYNPDNIGFSYQINAMSFAFYVNNMSLAKEIALADSGYRYDNEINTKGQVYRELGDSGSYGCETVLPPACHLPATASSRDRSDDQTYLLVVCCVCYTADVIGTMTEFMLLARATKLAGVDMYSYSNSTTGFGNLRAALAWMAPYCAKGSQCGNESKFKTPQAQAKCIGWPYPAVDYSPLSECTIVYALAALAYDNATYGRAAATAPDDVYDWWMGGLGIHELMELLYPPAPQ